MREKDSFDPPCIVEHILTDAKYILLGWVTVNGKDHAQLKASDKFVFEVPLPEFFENYIYY